MGVDSEGESGIMGPGTDERKRKEGRRDEHNTDRTEHGWND